MASRKKTETSKKPQYIKVKANRRKGGGGSDSSAVVRRSITLALFLFVVISLLAGVIFGFRFIGRQLFSENPSFEIQHLVITSDGRLTANLIREYTGREDEGIPPLCEGQNLFARTLEDIETTLMGSPLIESVELERELPNTLKINVKERTSVARIMGANTTQLPFVVDRFGVVLSYRLKDKTLPLIKGLDEELILGQAAENPDVAIALQIIMLCESKNAWRRFIKIDSLDVHYEDFIDMRINNGTQVRMPRYQLEEKLGKLSRTIEIGQSQGERYREINMTLDTDTVPVVP